MDYFCQLQQLADNAANCQTPADFHHFFKQLPKQVIAIVEAFLVPVLQQTLDDALRLKTLKAIAAKSAMRFHGYKPTSIRLLSGEKHIIRSPYFIKAQPKNRSRGKRKPNRANGCHLGLQYLGFVNRCSLWLNSVICQTALLCPSFQVAKTLLDAFGIELDVKTIRDFVKKLGEQTMTQREKIALSDADSVSGRMLLVCLDGGRLRQRRPKRGKRPQHLKRQGYHTDWREPTQIVIQWHNPDGSRCKDVQPLYDATMGNIDEVFTLLEAHLRQIRASEADLVVFCADGAKKYWDRIQPLVQRLGLAAHLEVIDYTHAKQNLFSIADMLPKKLGIQEIARITKQWKDLLWQGKLSQIYHQIRQLITNRRHRKQALKKMDNYFLKNHYRMRYHDFDYLDFPIGSGCVESAIRRVINLRIKSCGTFWKIKRAEVMLYLRSILLCGRWNTMLNNLLSLYASSVVPCH